MLRVSVERGEGHGMEPTWARMGVPAAALAAMQRRNNFAEPISKGFVEFWKLWNCIKSASRLPQLSISNANSSPEIRRLSSSRSG